MTARTTTARTRTTTAVACAAIALALALVSGCGDDGNDLELGAQPSASAPGTPTSDGAPAPDPDDADDPDGPDGDDRLAAGSVVAPSTAATTPVEPSGVVVPVVALDNSFRPERIEIAVGDEVKWENRGLNEHNVLRVEGEGWGVEVDAFQPGDVYGHVFTEPGEYRYFCSIHGNEDIGMIGTVVVTG